MIIEFITHIDRESDYPYETHTVSVDGVMFMAQSEGMEPEDACFGRDLGSPHECEYIIKCAIEATKAGEEVTILYTVADNGDNSDGKEK